MYIYMNNLKKTYHFKDIVKIDFSIYSKFNKKSFNDNNK